MCEWLTLLDPLLDELRKVPSLCPLHHDDELIILARVKQGKEREAGER